MNESINRQRHLVSRRATLMSVIAAGMIGCGGTDDPAAMPDAEVTAFWQGYFSAKSGRDADKISTYFGADVVYEDNSLRRRMTGNNAYIHDQWQALFSSVAPGPRSLLDAAHGTMSGAAVELTNEAGLFTSVPSQGLSIVDLRDGKIVRITDYWDSAQISEAEWTGLQAGFAMNPAWQATDTGNHPGTASATAGLQTLVEQFFVAYSAGSAASSLAFFDANATYVNKPLGIEAQGTAAIAKVLNATLNLLPDGLGAHLTHVVGDEFGGGVEWMASAAAPGAVLRGATVIDLTNSKISNMRVFFDSRLLTLEQKQRIADALR